MEFWALQVKVVGYQGNLSEKMSATYQGGRVPETMYFWHFKAVDYQMSCPNGTSKVTSIS